MPATATIHVLAPFVADQVLNGVQLPEIDILALRCLTEPRRRSRLTTDIEL